MAAGVAVLVGVPLLVAARPVPPSDLSTTALLSRIRAARDVPHTGRVEAVGRVGLPADSALATVAGLLGGTTRLRVWWDGRDRWRTATLRTTGETDLVHEPGATTRWVYESRRVTISPDVSVRLPTAVDALPAELARRVLAGARPDELSRLPSVRVAGRTAVGLRLTPADPEASVRQVDVWADAATGVPLRVDLLGATGPPAFSTAYTAFDPGRPDADVLTFRPPADATLHLDRTVDLASGADLYSSRRAPEDGLVGLPVRVSGRHAVGVYGRGPTLLLALPLRRGDARDLRAQLMRRPGARCTPDGRLTTSGPLAAMVTAPDSFFTPWLLLGTVTEETVLAAARALRTEGGLIVFDPDGDRFPLVRLDERCP